MVQFSIAELAPILWEKQGIWNLATSLCPMGHMASIDGIDMDFQDADSEGNFKCNCFSEEPRFLEGQNLPYCVS